MKRIFRIVLGAAALLLAAGAIAFPAQRQRAFQAIGISRPQTPAYQTFPARTGDLTAFVSATGPVRSNQAARITWQTSGQVASVNVQRGQQVEANAVLAELSQTSLAQNIILAQADLVTAQSALAEVLNNSQARANAEVALIEAQQALDDAEKAAQSATFKRASENTIDIARANLIEAEQAVDDAEVVFDQASARGGDDPVYATALSNLAKARQNETRAQYNLNYVSGLPDPVSVQLVYAQLNQANANLLEAKQNWDAIKDGPNPGDVAAAQARVAAAQATLDLARLAAPFNGTITAVQAQTGDMVSPGTAAFQIDDLSRLLVDLQVSEVDVNNVKVGQPVDITFDAAPNKTYAGQVTGIAPVGNTTSGTVNFTVTVQIINPDEMIRPPMTAAANIAVTELNDVLLIPNRAVRVVNNRRVVYLLRDNQAVPVVVILGPSDIVNSQLLSGSIQPGDLIILNPPAVPSSRSGGFFFDDNDDGDGNGGQNPGSSAPPEETGIPGSTPDPAGGMAIPGSGADSFNNGGANPGGSIFGSGTPTGSAPADTTGDTARPDGIPAETSSPGGGQP
ncbi:MAG: efflux RND transporter periplasmic adaptor subunit [Chloroflexi bacterium]|nr:MAG: efflux RND transporter periplasmic adaptor subunit [Chloroflexota bacterium]